MRARSASTSSSDEWSTKGVQVCAILSGGQRSNTDPARAKIDQLACRRYCGPDSGAYKGCIASYSSSSSDNKSLHHSKWMVMNSATAPNGVAYPYVTWIGSYNLNYSSGSGAYNNAVTIYGDQALYNYMDGNVVGNNYTYQAWTQQHYANDAFYNSSLYRGYYPGGAATIFASPSERVDLIESRLNDVTYESTYCRVRVMQAMFRDSRANIADQLGRMKDAGCGVWVVAGKVEPIALSKLRSYGIPVHQKNLIHDKVFLVRGKYGTAGTLQNWIYIGSHNLSWTANYHSDELFGRILETDTTNNPLYNGFYNHFNDTYNNYDKDCSPSTVTSCP